MTITIFVVLPEMVEPDLVIELATMTVMYDGTLAGGGGLLPVVVVQLPPQAGGLGLVELANPLKPDGARPPLNEFDFAHWSPQKVTRLPTAALPSPITNVV